jgi:hypothetical protein
MENKNKNLIRIGVAIAFTLLITLVTCQRNSLKEQIILEEKIKTAEDGLKIFEESRLREKDSLLALNEKSQKEIEKLKKENKKSEQKVKDLKKSRKKIKKQVENKTLAQVADTLRTIYKTDKVVATDISVNLLGNIPNKVLSDIVEKDSLEKEVAEKDKQLENKDNVISELEDINFNQTTMLISAEEQIKKEKENSELKDKLNKNLTKQVKKPRVDQILIGITAGVIGTLLITN